MAALGSERPWRNHVPTAAYPDRPLLLVSWTEAIAKYTSHSNERGHAPSARWLYTGVMETGILESENLFASLVIRSMETV